MHCSCERHSARSGRFHRFRRWSSLRYFWSWKFSAASPRCLWSGRSSWLRLCPNQDSPVWRGMHGAVMSVVASYAAHVIKKPTARVVSTRAIDIFLNVFIACLKFEDLISKLFSVMSKLLFSSYRCFEYLLVDKSICCLVFGGRLSKRGRVLSGNIELNVVDVWIVS